MNTSYQGRGDSPKSRNWNTKRITPGFWCENDENGCYSFFV